MLIKLLLYLYSFICCIIGILSIKASSIVLFGNNIFTGILAIILFGVIPIIGGLFLIFKVLIKSSNYTNNQLMKILLGSLLVGISIFTLQIIILGMIKSYNYTMWLYLKVFTILPLFISIKLFLNVIKNRKTSLNKS
jgi:hypothetical protein